jgi:hypothetical protein
VNALTDIITDLQRLPEPELQDAANYIHALAEGRRQRRLAMLERTSGSLDGKEGEAFAAAVAECERVDAHGW